MTDHQRRVRQFMLQGGQSVPRKPTVPDNATRLLRAQLILEEALETIGALGVQISIKPEDDGWLWLDKGSPFEFEPCGEVDLVEVADGCADLSVVTVGTLVACGIDAEPLLEEIDLSNLAKVYPECVKDSRGKIQKPEGWMAPDVSRVLKEQGWTRCS